MATTNDAYCTEAQVIAYAQYLSDFDGTTTPTEAQLLEFMENRAAELYSHLLKIMGSAAPGPAGYDTAIDTSTDFGKSLRNVLRQYNAIGAASDALRAAGAGAQPEASARADELYEMWKDFKDVLGPVAEAYIGALSVTANQYSIGEMTRRTITSRPEGDFPFTDTTEF